LRGIIDNFNNPIIVFTIIYDYFKIKNNLYLSRKNLVGSLQSIYKDLYLFNNKKNKRFYTLNLKRLRMIENLSLTFDVIFDYMTYDKLRTFFTLNVKNEAYHIPQEIVAFSELRRLLSEGAKGLISNNSNKVINYQKELMDKYKDIDDLNELSDLPIFVSIYNYLNRLKEISTT